MRSDDGAPEVLRLAYEHATVDVAARDAGVLEWLAEVLTPAFDRRGPQAAPADHGVRFEVDPARGADLARERESAAVEIRDGFTYDGSFSRDAVWADPRGGVWCADDRSGAFIHRSDDGRRFDLIVPQAEGSPRVLLLRVVRELATAAMYRAGRLPVHAAAFGTDEGVVLVCGPRRSGKTSTLVHALRCGAVLVSNDRVFVDPSRPPTARAMPTVVMLRDGTLERFEALRAAFEAARYDHRRTIAACAPGIDRPPPAAPPGHDRPGLSVPQLAALLGTRVEPGGRLRAVLFPRIDPAVRGIEIGPTPADAALLDLRQSLLEPSHPARYSEVFAPPDEAGRAIPPERHDEACRRLLECVPAYAARLGPDAFEHDLLRALSQAEAARPDRSGVR